ncbi:sigma-70 family RNA polymerase sigma factor [Catellatospora bangladeshensis]|uniref:RNA polymerase sigma factor n=1 Tax=Catellatospora bangladeshensis TaxID=310355 RepID=A0A8J3JUT8_9ACTN|nr:sigma-70 family RNA polymerase sigma factor [Catellatospora bangladeshensis]GIF85458.1 RNA polymerase sigma factor [Catellatospora bangladeshensis]
MSYGSHGGDDDRVTALALAARGGDRGAAEAFVAATQRDVTRFVAHLAGPADADDLAQDTYLRAMRALPSFEGRSSARTWLLAIARHTVVDHLRSVSRRPRAADLADWASVADAAQAGTGARFDEQILLDQLIGGLDPDRREAFVATQLLGLSYAEAAEVVGCPVGTIRSRVARARDDLTAALADGTPTPRRHLRAV